MTKPADWCRIRAVVTAGHAVEVIATVPVFLRIGPAEYEIGEVVAPATNETVRALLRAVLMQLDEQAGP